MRGSGDYRVSAMTQTMGRLRRGCRAVALACVLWPFAVPAQSIADLYYAALEADPTRAAEAAMLKASGERVKQATGQLMPTLGIAATSSYSRFDSAGVNAYREFQTDRATLQSQFALYRPALGRALREAETQRDAAIAGLDAAEAELLIRVVNAYFEVLAALEASAAIRSEAAATLQQLASAQQSFKVGTKAITDVRDAEAKQDLVIAKGLAADNTVAATREALRELVGLERVALRVLPLAAPDLVQDPADLKRLTEEALASSPLVSQAKLSVQAAQASVHKARAGHLPTLDVSVNYGPEYSTGTSANPIRTHGRNSQVEASLNLPLFAGGTVNARVREAQALVEKADADLAAAERKVATSVREAFYGLSAASAQGSALASALKSADVALQANRKGYSVGVNTNAEVLDAQSKRYQAQLDLMKAKLDTWLNYIKLAVISGRSWRIAVDEVDRRLVPESSTAAIPVSKPLARVAAKAASDRLQLKLSARMNTPVATR